jgi:hypothetical protein
MRAAAGGTKAFPRPRRWRRLLVAAALVAIGATAVANIGNERAGGTASFTAVVEVVDPAVGLVELTEAPGRRAEPFAVDLDAEITVLDCNGPCHGRPISLRALLDGEVLPWYGWGTTWAVSVQGGAVRALRELPLPTLRRSTAPGGPGPAG